MNGLQKALFTAGFVSLLIVLAIISSSFATASLGNFMNANQKYCASRHANWEPGMHSCIEASEYGMSKVGNWELGDAQRKATCDSGSMEWFCPKSPKYKFRGE